MEVVAADHHGLRADGGVDGIMLAKRVKNGAKADDNDSKAVVEAVAPPKKVRLSGTTDQNREGRGSVHGRGRRGTHSHSHLHHTV